MNHTPRPVTDFMPQSAAAGQAAALLRVLQSMPEGATRNELARASGLPIQSVCARIGELLESRDVYRGANRPDLITGHRNETIHATPPTRVTTLEAFTA